ncbi:hypothetical protein TKK_0008047 [Trichogramma kaykai]|uniref:Uncharacterized protein n=1 Tax=Trichogramma kaykai TaxID=54128 RepID=A0ABD2X6I6_9HYME
MLRNILSTNEDIGIKQFQRLKNLVKNNSKGYKLSKSSVFQWKEIMKFIEEAPDEQYLFMNLLVHESAKNNANPVESTSKNVVIAPLTEKPSVIKNVLPATNNLLIADRSEKENMIRHQKCYNKLHGKILRMTSH